MAAVPVAAAAAAVAAAAAPAAAGKEEKKVDQRMYVAVYVRAPATRLPMACIQAIKETELYADEGAIPLEYWHSKTKNKKQRPWTVCRAVYSQAGAAAEMLKGKQIKGGANVFVIYDKNGADRAIAWQAGFLGPSRIEIEVYDGKGARLNDRPITAEAPPGDALDWVHAQLESVTQTKWLRETVDGAPLGLRTIVI